MNWGLSRCAGALVLLAALSLPACGPDKAAPSPAEVSRGDVYFPEPPAPPRLQYLTTLTGGKSVKPKSKDSFADWVIGKEEQADTLNQFASPYGMDADNGKLYVCDVGADRVHVLDLNKQTYTTLGDANLVRNPVNITIDDATGLRYVCDTGVGRIHVFDRNDKYLRSISNDKKWTPIDLAIGNDAMYVCDVTEGVVWVLAPDGTVRSSFSRKGNGPDELSMPTNLEVGPDGRVYVTDSLQQVIKVFTPKGEFAGNIGRPDTRIGGFARPKGIAIDDDGVIYIADAQWDVVQLFNPEGQLLLAFGAPGEEPYSMGIPAGIAIDRSSLGAFRQFIAPDFDAEYLLFVVNQFGKNKLVVYAFGQKRPSP